MMMMIRTTMKQMQQRKSFGGANARGLVHLVVAHEHIGSTNADFTARCGPALLIHVRDVVLHLGDREQLDF
jgi:hypothetical protein